MLLVGGVPSQPSNCISRKNQVNRSKYIIAIKISLCFFYLQALSLSETLISLERGHFVAVKGPSGCGKTALVSEVLQNVDVTLKVNKCRGSNKKT